MLIMLIALPETLNTKFKGPRTQMFRLHGVPGVWKVDPKTPLDADFVVPATPNSSDWIHGFGWCSFTQFGQHGHNHKQTHTAHSKDGETPSNISKSIAERQDVALLTSVRTSEMVEQVANPNPSMQTKTTQQKGMESICSPSMGLMIA